MNKVLASAVLFLLISPLMRGSEPLVIDPDFEYKVLDSEMSVFHDETNSLNWEDVLLKEFIPNSDARPNLGFESGAVWVKFRVKNNSNDDNFRLQIHQPVLDTLNLFVLNSNRQLLDQKTFGEGFEFDHREYETPYFLYDLSLKKGESKNILLKIETAEQIVLPVYVATLRASRWMAQTTDLLFGAYFGLIMALALYNLFIFFSVRDRSYLYYVLYIIAVGTTQAVLEGYFQQYVWPDNLWLASRSVYLFTAFVSCSSILFLRDFLRTKVYTPKYDLAGKVIFGYFLVIVIAVLYEVNTIVHIASQIGISVVSFYILFAGIAVYKKGYKPAKFFIIAWSVLVAGIFVYALKDAGILPSTPVTNYMLQFGSAIEAIILSIALADRINILKQEKSASQEEALRVSKENERIVREQNIVLEERVKERTEELETSNHKLSDTISELKDTQTQLVQAEKMASLGQLTAGIAHEINNPINFVSANIEPLRYDVKDILEVLDRYDSINNPDDFELKKEEIEKLKNEIDLDYSKREVDELLKGIEEGAKRTAEIVSGLKNFSRIDESGIKEIDINEGIRSTLGILNNQLTDAIEVKLVLDENLPLVECMGGKINQVFLNIMNNALQSMEDNPPTKSSVLHVKTMKKGEDVLVEFSDTGIGMTQEVCDRVFEPFFTTKDVGKGTGLGLSIAFKIVETHQGKIDVKSKPDIGSTFTLSLPIKARIQTEAEI